ncbi:MAG: alpha-xylosidase [Provencibacterium sp.]|jgi:alpha-D-xyloside xylohydrolase|nr:alpha-xylosidase [Provencibacterium sp.]
MKFTNGMWLTRSGYQVETPKELYTADVDADGITLYCPYVRVLRRGNTLDGGMLTIRLSSPAEDVLSVKLMGRRGSRKKEAHFSLNRRSVQPVIQKTENGWSVSSGRMTAAITGGADFSIRFLFDGKPLTSTCAKNMAHVTGQDGEVYLRERLELDVGENIFGLGERFSAFVKNGQSVDIWNEDGGTDSEQSYKNIPFFMSGKGYGVLVNHCGRVSFEVGSESVTKTQFSVPGEEMEYFILGGKEPKEVLRRYASLTGLPPALPLWSYGLWLSTSFTTAYDEKTVLSFIDGMREREIPLSVFHFDCFWMKEYEWCNFLWDSATFPDPEGLLRKIHERGIKVCVWINPYIGQKSPLFEEGYQNDYFVNTGSGDVWQWDRWQAGMALVDFTNPEAKRWYQQKLERLLDMGVDSFKTDFGERIPTADAFFGPKAEKEGIRYHDGSDPEGMHNYYTYLYNQAVYEVLARRFGEGEACLFARSATVGSQCFPVHWGGDNLSTYPSMAESLRGGLSLGLCGFPYWSHDIGGFEAGCHPDIYKRWTQFGLLSSHSRYHGNSEYKAPWFYGEEAVEVTRSFAKLKNRLVPYLYSTALLEGRQGVPLMRAMFLEFPEDPACQTLDRQYLFGDTLLVAPIFRADGMVEYYLPEGTWVSLLSGEELQGPGWRHERHGYQSLPLLIRPNRLLVLGSSEDSPLSADEQELTLVLGHLDEGVHAERLLAVRQEEPPVRLTASRYEGTITLCAEGLNRPYSALIYGLDGAWSAEGASLERQDKAYQLTGCTGKVTLRQEA